MGSHLLFLSPPPPCLGTQKEGGMVMKFTKFISGLLVIVCVFVMAGCGASENEASKNTVDNNTANASGSQKI